MPPRIAILSDWIADRGRRRSAESLVRWAMTDPPLEDVSWLARSATSGDADHARWELRYARRSAAVIVAQRDALDDLTASVVTAALARAVRADPAVAPDRREIALRQFNVRLAAYGGAARERGGAESTSERMARVMLGFAGVFSPEQTAVSGTAEIIARTLADASEALREAFGLAVLPENERPSAAIRQESRRPESRK